MIHFVVAEDRKFPSSSNERDEEFLVLSSCTLHRQEDVVEQRLKWKLVAAVFDILTQKKEFVEVPEPKVERVNKFQVEDLSMTKMTLKTTRTAAEEKIEGSPFSMSWFRFERRCTEKEISV